MSIQEDDNMEITEMLDELKQKALRDPALRAEFLQTRKLHSRSVHSVRNAGELDMKSMIWI